ncbi:glycine cleavage system protein R [Trichloromonas sp.]|uniref:glycine cleavage system protein R n=1 Tax=Trichloromonas sp. TaxID=3069249 RepID=UPI003D81416A
MDNRFILTAFGKDRPGIVADVTRILFENGCNLEDNSMTLLADEFTLILLFSSPRANIQALLLKACEDLERSTGVSASIRPLESRRPLMQDGSCDCTLHVEGMDQAGIVYKISRHLADRGINIIDLKSAVKPSPESGTAIYLMDIHIQVPQQMDLEQVESDLTSVADELHVDIALAR